MKRYVFILPVDLPGGKFVLITAEVPDTIVDDKDWFGVPLRMYWTSKKLYKLKINAEKAKDRIQKKQRSDHYNEVLISKGLFSMN